MEVGVLGHVTLPGFQPGRRARALLAVLALTGDEPVDDEELVIRTWPTPPPDAEAVLHALRTQLDGVLDQPLTTDADRFVRLTRDAGLAAAEGDLVAAGAGLSEALSLWRGDALEDVRDTPYLQAEARRLTELRLTAVEDEADLELRLGGHGELVPRLRALLVEHPTRERLWGLLMTALFRAGRGEEAVTAYAEARDTLADELGIEPGAALQQLEAGILRNDPALGAGDGVVQPRRRARVPVLASSTFGREDLTDEMTELLSRDDVRLVTLTGIGGSGKSRVATLVATAVQDVFADIVYLQVTEATAARQLPLEVALALELDTRAHLADAIATLGTDWRGLVVLDNLEALAEGPDVVHRLLAASPNLTVLVTSRVLLRLPGERELPVPPLVVPGIAADHSEIAAASSVQLFVDRATAASPSFALTGEERAVAELCGLLDGLPLAIELAAARVKVRSLDRILDGLRSNLDLLATGSEGVPERQRAMATAIRWSYDRLTPHEQVVCERLTLFERGFTIEALEAVCADVPDVVEALASIVDARLVRPMESRADVRFVVLGTVRAFARERLSAGPGVVPSRERLTAYLTTRALAASTRLFGPDAIVTQAQFDDDAADIAGAVGWALEAGRRGMAVDLLLASLDGWTAAGRHVEALDLTLRALDHVPQQGPEAARLLAAATQLTHQLADHERSRTFGRQALDLAERLGDRESVARALAPLAATLVFSGEVAEGAALAETAAAEAEALELYPLSVHALFVLGMARAMSGDFDGERRAHEARLAAARARGDLKGTADALNTLAEIAVDNADGETAEVFAAEAASLAGGRLPTVTRDAALTRARAALLQGDLPAAARQLTPALDLADRLGQTFAVAQGLRVGGCLAVASGDADTAVRLFAAAHALSPSPGGADVPPEQDLAAPLAEARTSLGEQAYARSWTLGTGLPSSAARVQLAALLTRLTESPTPV